MLKCCQRFIVREVGLSVREWYNRLLFQLYTIMPYAGCMLNSPLQKLSAKRKMFYVLTNQKLTRRFSLEK